MQNMKGILRLSEKIKLKIVRVVRKSYIDILLWIPHVGDDEAVTEAVDRLQDTVGTRVPPWVSRAERESPVLTNGGAMGEPEDNEKLQVMTKIWQRVSVQ